MPRKNRGYKREKEYFTMLAEGHRRVKVRLLPPPDDDSGKSAPKHVVERATNYIEKYGLVEDDQLWLVMDVDCWSKDLLIDIGKECQEKNGWNIALSNPCFEVWLHSHLQDIAQMSTKTCKELKGNLHHLISGGYKVEAFITLVDSALERATIADKDNGHFFPTEMTTKVYLLVDEIKQFFQN